MNQITYLKRAWNWFNAKMCHYSHSYFSSYNGFQHYVEINHTTGRAIIVTYDEDSKQGTIKGMDYLDFIDMKYMYKFEHHIKPKEFRNAFVNVILGITDIYPFIIQDNQ